MFRLNLELLKDKGITAVKFYLRQQGMGHRTAQRWVDGDIEQLNLPVLFRLCVDLNCTPNDLLVPVGPEVGQLAEGHVLRGLVREEAGDMMALLHGLSAAEIRELKGRLRGGELGGVISGREAGETGAERDAPLSGD